MTNTSENVIVKVKSIVLNFPRKQDFLSEQPIWVLCGFVTEMRNVVSIEIGEIQ